MTTTAPFDCEVHRPVGRGDAQVVDGCARDVREVDRRELERAALVEAREQEQVLDEHAHARRRLLDALHRLGEVVGTGVGTAAEELGVSPDRGERRAELVRRVGDEPPQARFRCSSLRERLLDLAEHGVERETEPPDLGGVVGGLDATRKVTGRDRARGLTHLLERAQAEVYDPPGEQGERAEHARRDEYLDDEEVAQRLVDVGEGDRDDEEAGCGEPEVDGTVRRMTATR